MGYRSEVSLTMKKEDIIELLKQAAEKDEKHNASAYLCLDNILDHKDGYASLYWDWVKWYDSYGEIALVKQFMDEAICDGKDVSFKRIGEDNDDYESEWSGDWEVCEKIEFVRRLEMLNSDEVDLNNFLEEGNNNALT